MPNWFDEYVEDNLTGGGGGGDTTPPTDSASATFSGDYQVAKDQSITVGVVDAASGIAYVKVGAKLTDRVPEELVYSGTGGPAGFLPPYARYSSISGSGAAGVGYSLTVRRDDGWPKATSVAIRVVAVDAKGNVRT